MAASVVDLAYVSVPTILPILSEYREMGSIRTGDGCIIPLA